MKLKKRIQLVLACLCLGIFSCITACTSVFGERGPKFLEGAYTEITVGKSILIDEFVEFDDEQEYEFTITDPRGKERDYSARPIWTPEDLGEYVMTYTILSGLNKGEATHVVNVVPNADEFSVTYNNRQLFTIQRDDAVIFEDFFRTLNLNVSAYANEYEVEMVSVTVDGSKTELIGETEYTPESLSDHIFRFRVTTPYGQSKEMTVIVAVQYMDEAMQAWLSQENVEVYQYLLAQEVEDKRTVTLNAGAMTGKAANVGSTDIPYIAYNGEYGVGDYVTFDFTGSNLPQLVFFAKENTSNLVDGEEGVFINNGFGVTANSESKRLTTYGPWKIGDGVFGGGEYRMDVQKDSIFGASNLSKEKHYRYIAGVSNVENITYKENDTNYTGCVPTLHLLLADLDNGVILFDTEIELTKMARYRLTEEYFKGNIVAHGSLDEKRTWDNVYPVYENKNSIYEVFSVSEFKTTAQLTVKRGAPLKVSDYVDTSDVNATFYYKNADGERTVVEITQEEFSFAEVGEYTLFYQASDETKCATSIKVTALDLDDSAWAWLNENNVRLYGASLFTATQGVTLKEGNYSGVNEQSIGMTDLPYINFTTADGKGFGFGDSVAFEFTGNNLPYLSFFNENIVAGAENFVNKRGLIFSPGVTSKQTDGTAKMSSLGESYRLYGPKSFGQNAWNDYLQVWTYKNTADYTVTTNSAGVEKTVLNGSYYGLSSDAYKQVKFRCIVGFTDLKETTTSTGVAAWKIGITLYLINLDTNEEVFKIYQQITKEKTLFGNSFVNEEDFTGNIILYGRPYEEITLDKVYPIFQGQKPDSVKAAFEAE